MNKYLTIYYKNGKIEKFYIFIIKDSVKKEK